MKRLIAIGLAVIMTLSSSWISTTYAAESAGETLRNFGLLKGDQYGNLNENQYLTRAEMMVILARMLGEFNQAETYARKSTFSDSSNHWAEPYVAYAQFRGWTVGIGNNQFGYQNRHTVREASVFMLKALGYIADVDFTWSTAYTKAAQLGLFSTTALKADQDILRGDLFKMMLQSLYTKVKGLDITLGQVLKVLPPTSTVFEVKTVKATSLKEILVTFSKPLDRTTVSNTDFAISGQTLTATVLSDGFTVSLTTSGTLSNMTQYSLVIDGIRSTDGLNLNRTTMTFIAADTEAPKVISIVPASSASIEITFSEPIMTLGTVTFNSSSLVFGITSMSGAGTNKILVQLNGNMMNGVTYAVTVRDFKDHVNNNSVYFSGSMLYRPDTTPATAKVLFANQAVVAFEFTKPVKGFTTSHFYHTYAAWTPLNIYKDEAMTQLVASNELVSRVYVRFAMKSGNTILGYQLPSGAVNVTILEYGGTGQRLQDSWGNSFTGGTYRVNVVADTTRPTVTKLDASGSNTLTLEFSESVKFNLNNIQVLYSTGATIPNLWLSITGTGKSYTIQFNGIDLTGRSIRINLTNVEDEALIPNTMTSYTKTLTMPDLIAPTLTEVVKDSNLRYVYVYYSEPMNISSTTNTASITNRRNYTIYSGSSSLVLSTNPTLISGKDNRMVQLALTSTEYTLALSNNAYLLIANVQDNAGNALSTQSIRFSNMPDLNLSQPQLNSVRATELRTITAVLSPVFTTVSSNAISILIGSNEYAAQNLTVTPTGNQTIITFQINRDLPYDLANTRLKIDTSSTNPIDTLYGYRLADVTRDITDEIKPAIAKTTSGPVRDDIKIATASNTTTITITFTEAIKVMDYPLNTFSVSDAEVTKIDVNANKVVITITPEDDMSDTPTLTMNGNIQDLSGNTFRATGILSTYK